MYIILNHIKVFLSYIQPKKKNQIKSNLGRYNYARERERDLKREKKKSKEE